MTFALHTSKPFTSRKAMLKGLAAGSLMVSGLLNGYWAGWRFMLFAAGILVFIDALMPYGEELHTGAAVAATLTGGVTSLVFTVFGGVVSYTILMAVAGGALYAYLYVRGKNKTWLRR